MSKGSGARPFSVSADKFASNWDAIFGPKKSEPDLSVYNDERLVSRFDKQELAQSRCGCYNCTRDRDPQYTISHMIVCPSCGNKRCPRATDHRYECTDSNEPGQPGSRY